MIKNYIHILLVFNLSIFFSQTFPIATIPDSLKDNSIAVVRKNDVQITIESVDKMVVKNYMAVTVLDKAADKQFATKYIHYSPSSKIKNIDYIILDANGKEIKEIKRKDFMDISAIDGGTMYSDERILVYNYIPTQYPYTMVFQYEYQTSNTIFMPDFSPFIGYKVGIEKEIFSITNLSGIELKSKNYNFSSFNIKEKNTLPENISLSLENIKPIIEEPYSPTPYQFFPRTEFTLNQFMLEGEKGDFSSWKNFGKWFYEHLLKQTNDLSIETKNEIINLIKDKITLEEKVNTLYKFMQNKTRYISIQEGIGGWKPMNASFVQKQGYGDCKALTNYMKALLDASGIKSYYTRVYADNSIKHLIDNDFPSMNTNHVILSIPNDKETIWLECTSQKSAYNHLGRFTGDRTALQMREEGAFVVETQKYPSEKNTEDVKCSIVLDAEGNSKFDFKSEQKGTQYDYFMYYENKDTKELKEKYKNEFSELQNLELDEYTVKNDREIASFSKFINGKATKTAKKVGNNLIFQAIYVNRFSSNIKKDEDRKLPLYIGNGMTDTYNFEYTIPDGYLVDTLPENISILSEFGLYSLNIKNENNSISVKRIFKIKESTHPKEKFNEFALFLNKVSKADNSKILLKMK